MLKVKKERKSMTKTTDSEWPTHAELVLPDTGKGLLLTDQHVYVAHVVRHAITDLTKQTLLEDAFLDTDQKINYHRGLLKRAAHDLKSGNFPIGDIYECLIVDAHFCDALGKLVCVLLFFVPLLTGLQVTDCLSVIRGPVKTNASVEIAAYELGVGAKCMEHVNALFDCWVYIFPGSWIIDPKTRKEVRVWSSNLHGFH
jgi:hypothetical protein